MTSKMDIDVLASQLQSQIGSLEMTNLEKWWEPVQATISTLSPIERQALAQKRRPSPFSLRAWELVVRFCKNPNGATLAAQEAIEKVRQSNARAQPTEVLDLQGGMPIEQLSPQRPDLVQRWITSLPDGKRLKKLEPQHLTLWLSFPLTLAYWLIPHVGRLGANPQIVLVGATMQAEGMENGLAFRYVAPLLTLPRIDFIFIGKEMATRMIRAGNSDYPSTIKGIQGRWEDYEKEIIQSVAAAFFFNPGLHSKLETQFDGIADEHATDLLETGAIMPTLNAGIPVGMTAYDRYEASKDAAELAEYGMRAANLRDNPWGRKSTVPLLDPQGEVCRYPDGQIVYNTNGLCIWDVEKQLASRS